MTVVGVKEEDKMKEKGVGFGHWGGCLDGEGP